MSTSLYIATLVIEDDVVAKLCQKHHVTVDEVRGLLQWPARVKAAWDDDKRYGPRWLAMTYAGDEPFFAVLDPIPEWEGGNAEMWSLRTAYWL